MNFQTKSTVAIITLVLILVLIIIFQPLAVLWSLNTLFPVLAIPYTFWSWLAVVVLNLTWMYKPTLSKD